MTMGWWWWPSYPEGGLGSKAPLLLAEEIAQYFEEEENSTEQVGRGPTPRPCREQRETVWPRG